MLLHLREDIDRFVTVVHQETAGGEQFNKYIREALFLTNRKHPSRDVARSFGETAMLEFIVNGEIWDKDEGKGQAGVELQAYGQDPKCKDIYFGSAEFEEPNGTELRIKTGSFIVVKPGRKQAFG